VYTLPSFVGLAVIFFVSQKKEKRSIKDKTDIKKRMENIKPTPTPTTDKTKITQKEKNTRHLTPNTH